MQNQQHRQVMLVGYSVEIQSGRRRMSADFISWLNLENTVSGSDMSSVFVFFKVACGINSPSLGDLNFGPLK